MDLYYGRTNDENVATIEHADTGWLEAGIAVTATVQPQGKAVAGESLDASLGPLWCTVRHDGACRVTLTPVIDDVVRDDLTASYDFPKQADNVARNRTVKLYLSEPLTWPGDSQPFSRQAVRGQRLTVRATLQPIITAEVLSGSDPAPEVFGMGGFTAEVRPLHNVDSPSIPA